MRLVVIKYYVLCHTHIFFFYSKLFHIIFRLLAILNFRFFHCGRGSYSSTSKSFKLIYIPIQDISTRLPPAQSTSLTNEHLLLSSANIAHTQYNWLQICVRYSRLKEAEEKSVLEVFDSFQLTNSYICACHLLSLLCIYVNRFELGSRFFFLF